MLNVRGHIVTIGWEPLFLKTPLAGHTHTLATRRAARRSTGYGLVTETQKKSWGRLRWG